MSARTDVARLASKSGDTSDDFKLDSLPGVDPDIFAEWKYAWELFAGTTDNAIDDAKFDLLLNSVGCDGDLDSLTLPGSYWSGYLQKKYSGTELGLTDSRHSFKKFVLLMDHHLNRPSDGPCCNICGARESIVPAYNAFECRPKKDPHYCTSLGRRMDCEHGGDFVSLPTVLKALDSIYLGNWEHAAAYDFLFGPIRIRLLERNIMVYPGPCGVVVPSRSMIAAIMCLNRADSLPHLSVDLLKRIYKFNRRPRTDFETYQASVVCEVLHDMIVEYDSLETRYK
eukprot:g7900.t1